MKINYNILKHLLDCNKSIKLKFTEETNILEIFIYNDIVATLSLNNGNIEDNSDIIYKTIVNIDNITIYIPKIYTKEN